MSTILRNSSPVARKRHICEWCGQAIEPGTRYDAEARIWEGDFYYLKAHQGCNKLAYLLWAEGDYADDEGLDMDGFKELVREYYMENCPNPAITTKFPERLEWVLQERGIAL